MVILQNRLTRKIFSVINDGTKFFPAKMERRHTGNISFRVSFSGTSHPTLEVSLEFDKESFVHKVLKEGFAVRCKSVDGEAKGIHKYCHCSVSEVILES